MTLRWQLLSWRSPLRRQRWAQVQQLRIVNSCCNIQSQMYENRAAAFYSCAPGATETVATVGLWQQEPNIYNAIPRSVRALTTW